VSIDARAAPTAVAGLPLNAQSSGFEVGTKATTGANRPASFRKASSAAFCDHNATIAIPSAISPPTNTDRTGV
jgi:hypothetical protein